MREVKLSHLENALSDLDYPLARGAVVAECGDVTLVLAEGEANLGEIVSDSNADRFESMDDLAGEVMNLLPRRAVGEPYQSEGEG